MNLNKDARIYVAGHRGLVGSALTRRLQAGGWRNIIQRTHAELDLQCEDQVNALFAAEKPHYVFVAAARVGGIHANNSYPVDFLLSNLRVQNSVIDAAWRHGVAGLLFLGSSCIYPKLAPQPLKEEYLLTGPLEPTNEAYAIAKIAGIKLCESFNRQYGARFVSVMPTNLYGPGDSYDLLNSHVLPAFIRKFHLARLAAAGNRQGIARDEQVFGIIPPDFSHCLNAIAAANGHGPVLGAEHIAPAVPAMCATPVRIYHWRKRGSYTFLATTLAAACSNCSITPGAQAPHADSSLRRSKLFLQRFVRFFELCPIFRTLRLVKKTLSATGWAAKA